VVSGGRTRFDVVVSGGRMRFDVVVSGGRTRFDVVVSGGRMRFDVVGSLGALTAQQVLGRLRRVWARNTRNRDSASRIALQRPEPLAVMTPREWFIGLAWATHTNIGRRILRFATRPQKGRRPNVRRSENTSKHLDAG